MKKNYFILLFLIVILLTILTGSLIYYKKYRNISLITNKTNNGSNVKNITDSSRSGSNNSIGSITNPKANLDYPIAEFSSRITKKPFGIYITPATSPVQPERFNGYHTGTDIEYTDVATDVPVFAIEKASVRYVGTVSGYGGVIILEATINNQTDTILYGHLRISSSQVKVGDTVSRGQQLALLGTGYSSETSGERRHLHFSIHKGSSLVFLGYVQNKTQLSDWLNPVSIYQ